MEHKRFIKTVEAATSAPFRAGNAVTILRNGDEIFPAMLEAIRAAEHTIEFLSFVFWRSTIANDFAAALAERARHGIKVRVLVDAVGGASVSARTIWQLEQAGAQVRWYHPGRWQQLRNLNHRTHRKILVVDSKIGFTGGVGIAAQWTGNAQDMNHWRETHCRIEGPACHDLQVGFAQNWPEPITNLFIKSEGANTEAGKILVHTTLSTANTKPTAMEQLLDAILATTKTRLWITSAYFVPDITLMARLIDCAGRGVDVKILTNGTNSNHRITMLAGRATYRPLLEAGIEIYEYQKTIHHAKVISADKAFATLGSTNLDARSLVLNDEINVSFVDSKLVATLDAQFEQDLRASRRLTVRTWAKRSRFLRLAESGSHLFASQL